MFTNLSRVGTRDVILDAAAGVMRERGLANVTTRQIAAAAGFSEATLYKHFADKVELMLAVLQERSTGYAELTAALGRPAARGAADEPAARRGEAGVDELAAPRGEAGADEPAARRGGEAGAGELAARPAGGEADDLEERLAAVALAAIVFYTDNFPMLASIFSDRKILEGHTDGLRKHGLGPHKVNEAIADYLRAERDAGRIRADADLYAGAGLLAGACLQHAFLGHMGWAERRDDDTAARSFARTVMAGLR